MGTTAEELKAAGIALGKSIIDGAEARARQFLDDNAGSREFVTERARRYGELAGDYFKATDTAASDHALEQMGVVQQSVENEISAVAVHASIASIEEFKKIMGSILDTAKAVLPIILSLIKG